MQGIITDEQARTIGTQISDINDAIAEKIGSRKYRIWFKNSTKMTLTAEYLKVGVPNLFMANWIENHFSNAITQAVHKVTGSRPKITYTVDPELAGAVRRTRPDSATTLSDGKQSLPDKQTYKPKPASAGKVHFSLSTFVVGSSNQLAYNAAKAVVQEKHCPFNPLFIHGGYGVGKTHLLQGICNAVYSERPETNWLYLSAEDFANQFVLALKTKKLEAFRRRMRQTDLLAIDDIHFLASKPSIQEEFLHTFNTIDLAGKQVVLVSDAHPKMIGQISEKLVSRFVSGMVVKIDIPGFNTRCQICRQFAERLTADNKNLSIGKNISEIVIKYIAENMRTNVRELEGALLKLIAYAALQNQKVSLPMAQTVLAEHLDRCDPIVHISDIESAVATFFAITPANIRSSKKDRTVALARHFCMYLTRKHTKMSSSEIGRFMGNKNHATVLLACRRIESLLERNAEVFWNGPAGNKVSKARNILAQLESSISK
jgi:chromosomal replication initiator protein